MRYAIQLISCFYVLLLLIRIQSVDSYGKANCECLQSAHWTRDCCGPTGGYFLFRKCYYTFGFSFIQCCRQVGLRGVCVA